MANKKISELTTRTPSLTDLILVGDPTSGYSYKCTVSALATIIETDIADAYVTLDTAQTISGAKTFSNNLTLTSVTNAATTQTKFLTLNGSNVVNYRTGSQVLADIGASDDTLVVHKAGDETITGIKTFSARGKFDAGINLKQGSGASLDTGYSAISADATTFYFHRSTSIAALSVNNLTTTRTYTLQDANGTLAFLSDIPSLTGYVPTSRTLTINGTSYDLSANRTWSVGTVTSVGLSTGTTGTDISVSGSPVTSSGTITLNIPTASATNRGALSSTDWTTFNNKQNAITLTTTGTSGAATLVGSTLNIPQYQSVLTNPVTGTGTTNYIPKFTSSSAIGNSQIQDDGTNVGVGGSPSSQKLRIYGGTIISNNNFYYGFNSGGSQATIVGISSADNITLGQNNVNHSNTIIYGGTGTIQFSTGGSERMRLDASGNLFVGLTSNSGLNAGSIVANSVLGAKGFLASHQTSIGVLEFNNNVTAIRSYGATAGTGVLAFNVGGGGGSADFEAMRLNASGNLGLGVSPSAWSLGKAIDISGGMGLLGYNNGSYYTNNAYYNAGWFYKASSTASYYFQANNGEHQWYNAPSGIAANPITFTQVMTLVGTSDVKLSIGTTANDGNANYGNITLNGVTGSLIDVRQNGTLYGRVRAQANEFALLSQGASSVLVLGTNNTERMRIIGNGYVGINTNSPAGYLDVLNSGVARLLIGYAGNSENYYDANTQIFRSGNSTERMRLDASGNLGLGVTPSAWSGGKAIQVKNSSNPIFISETNGDGWFGYNAYYNGTNWTYVGSYYANAIKMADGNFAFMSAPSGTAGTAISFTQAMTLDASGQLLIGLTSNTGGGRIEVQSNATSAITTRSSSSGVGQTVKSIRAVNSAADQFANSQYDALSHAWILSNSTQAMTLFSTGNLAVGGTSDNGSRLNVTGAATFSSSVTANAASTINGAYPQLILNNPSAGAGIELHFKDNGTLKSKIGTLDDINSWQVYNGGAIRFTINNSGNVGIGTTSPAYKLQVGDLANTSGVVNDIFITGDRVNTNNYYARLIFGNSSQSGGSTASIRGERMDGSNFATGLTFYTNGTGSAGDGSERMRITSGGNVGIGTTSPAYPLQVAGIGKFEVQSGATNNTAPTALIVANKTTGAHTSSLGSSLQFEFTNSGGAYSGGLISSVGGADPFTADLRFSARNYGYVEAMRITSGGEVLIGTTSDAGDYKLQVNGNGYFSNSVAGLVVKATNTGASSYLRLESATIADLWFGRENSSGTSFGLPANSSTIFSEGAYPFSLYVNGSTRLTITSSGNTELTGSIKTAAPSGGTAKPIKFGEIVTLGGSNTQGVRVEIDGTVYYLVTGYLP